MALSSQPEPVRTPNRLAELLDRAGIKHRDFAKQMNVNEQTVSRWVTGLMTPRPARQAKIAGYLGVSASTIWPSSPPPASVPDLVELWPTRSDVPTDRWERLFSVAQHEIFISAYSAWFLAELMPRWWDRLRSRQLEGVRIRILLGDPNSEMVRYRDATEVNTVSLADRVRYAITQYSLRLSDEHTGNLLDGVEIRIQGTYPMDSSYFVADEQMMVCTHLPGANGQASPTFQFQRRSVGDRGIFGSYYDGMETLWNVGRVVTPELLISEQIKKIQDS